MVGNRVEADDRHDEVGRNHLCALMQQLVISMLTVGTHAAPDDRAGVGGGWRTVLTDALAVGLHVQLLQVFGDVTQVVVVRQDRVALRIPEVAVPDTQQRQQHRHVLFERGALEMLVHRIGAGQQFLEVGHADSQRDRQADGRPQRIATANPVPHREDVFFTDAEGYGRRVVAGNRDEVAMQFNFGAALRQVPCACSLSVFQGFQRVEGLRRDDEECGLGANFHRQFMKLAAIDVRQVMATYTFVRVGHQRFGDQLRAEERAADADVHHVGDRLFSVTAPQAVMDAADQFGHLIEYAVYVRHHIDTVDFQLVADRPAQSGVQRRATFG
ncbi:glucosephosphate isomerase [Pseudomonas amygdali pv. eriobotryae]|uniref:Glucosephosphate isomerase n=1 Tax=Pseudomonas amygdali pv. eriobotryae TaxID=129137 RepID=A0A3M3W1F0_PSEA0|nr:glucosephosphate isomerase [Pseudomonas amygdali pv. eriobotryae]